MPPTPSEPPRGAEDPLRDLRALADAVRAAVRAEPAEPADRARLARPTRQGAGDLTYGIDEGTERAATAWLAARAARGPLSLFTEDEGWRHAGGAGDATDPFDHGGPRVVVDPIDGTRGLMLDLRSAWTEGAWCPPGAGEPRARDVTASILSELPDRRAAAYRVLTAEDGAGARIELRALDDGRVIDDRALAVDEADDALEHRVLSFFRYEPRFRPRIAALEAAFFERLATHEGVDPRHCFDDQYISNAGQLAMLALGSYRFVCDLRGWVADRAGEAAVTSKPYDVVGALHLARAAGCVVEAPDGGELDFPLDATTPVSWIGYANAATADRLRPHVRAVLGAEGEGAVPGAGSSG